MAYRIEIDRGKRLADEPHLGHNRYHPDIEPILEVGEGEEVVVETRDAGDGRVAFGDSVDVLADMDSGAIHPLTGPIFVKGAEPGDGLEIEFLDIEPQATGFSLILPGLGFLRDVMTTPFLVHWTIKDGWATSEEIPGVRIPGAPFMGISAVAPSAKELEAWTAREARLIERGGMALPPDPNGAVPGGTCGFAGLRTMPPRENGGNFDVKQLTRGVKLTLPVFKEGALFSTGDGHFAQGDGEVCVTAVEMGATVAVRFKVLKSAFAQRRFKAPIFTREDYFADPRFAAPQRVLGVMGIPVDEGGENRGEDLMLACRNAVLNMMELLMERGYSREQAYVICSVAVDLRISNVVDVPNFVVCALLPEAIFDGD
jgi:formamidase